MTVIKEQVIELVRRMPDENMTYILGILKNVEALTALENDSAYAEREKMLALRESIYQGEASRLAGEQAYSVDEIRMMLEKKYNG